MTLPRTAISQETDIRGSENRTSTQNIAEEQQGLGAPVGPTGNTASIISITGTDLVIVGLTGMTPNSRGHTLSLSGCNDPNNDGNFSIVQYLSPNSAVIVNGFGSAPDLNNGNIIWEERYVYSLEADLNYERADRALIKGVDYYQTVQPYTRPNATNVEVPTNLTNISGQTTDAVAYPGDREIFGQSVLSGQSKVLMVDPGQLKHMDPINTLGIPCFDTGTAAGNFYTCFVKVLDGYVTGSEMLVLSGAHAGERIFGVTNNGSSISPNSVEVVFYSCPLWADIAVHSTPYTWESGQPNIINLAYGYNQRLDNFDFNNLRLPVTIPNTGNNGGGGITPFEHETLRQLIHFIETGGPGHGFTTNAYKEITPFGSVFPTSIIWYIDSAKTQKITEKILVWQGVVPTTITWNVYNADGITIAQSATDTISYTNIIFEISRIRIFS